MSHRVISGKAKGRRLKSVPGDTTRPIMDKVKQALFNILGQSVVEADVLDLFAGTGAVGIEALSRGAAFVTFVDSAPLAVKTIQENLAHTGFSEQAEVLRADAFNVLKRDDLDPYTLVYIAPPQYANLWRRALEALDQAPHLLEPDALVIVQIDPKERQDLSLRHLHPYDERTYGNTLLWFFEYQPDPSPSLSAPKPS